jgi:hypothetical protein
MRFFLIVLAFILFPTKVNAGDLELEPPSNSKQIVLAAITPETHFLSSIKIGVSNFAVEENKKIEEKLPIPAHNALQGTVNGKMVDISTLQLTAQKMCLDAFGIGQFTSLSNIIQHESGWNPNAEEPKTHARGIGQALPSSKMSNFGEDYMTNPITQLKWMISYIRSRYVNPNNAWDFWEKHHWY